MRAVSLTNRGGRKNNEDYVGYANSDKLWCFVVCDGLGGQSFGEVASEIVCETVCKSFKKAPELSGKALYRYIEKAASVLGEERESTKSNMSSTIVALVTDGEKSRVGTFRRQPSLLHIKKNFADYGRPFYRIQRF